MQHVRARHIDEYRCRLMPAGDDDSDHSLLQNQIK
jgi:hypothetical protein